MNAALIIIPTSIWQMLRGSIILFTAILTLTYRHKKLYAQQWCGIIFVIVALVLIGVTTVLSNSNADLSAGKMVLGVMLVVIAQAIQAFQTIAEEQLLHDSTTPPMQIVAWEGFWGFCICSFIGIPMAYFIHTSPGDGLSEDTPDSFYMMSLKPMIILLVVLFILFVALFNIFGMFMFASHPFIPFHFLSLFSLPHSLTIHTSTFSALMSPTHSPVTSWNPSVLSSSGSPPLCSTT